MRCRTAKDYFCRNRDGTLDEAARMRLQEHLSQCPECTEFCGEMDGCLEMLEDLSEIEVSENFEWNLKRRIAMEKSKAMRSRGVSDVGGLVWGSKFVAAAAATLVIALAGAWMLAGRESVDLTAGERLAQETVRTSAPEQRGEVRFTQTGYPAGIQYVSDDYLGNASLEENSRQLPFSMASDPRMDYLLRENELLRRQVEALKFQNAYMQKVIMKQRTVSKRGKR
jgi:hypothetical protein